MERNRVKMKCASRWSGCRHPGGPTLGRVVGTTEIFDEVKFANSGQANNHGPVDVHFGYFDVERFKVLRMFIKNYDFNVKNVADGSTIFP